MFEMWLEDVVATDYCEMELPYPRWLLTLLPSWPLCVNKSGGEYFLCTVEKWRLPKQGTPNRASEYGNFFKIVILLISRVVLYWYEAHPLNNEFISVRHLLHWIRRLSSTLPTGDDAYV